MNWRREERRVFRERGVRGFQTDHISKGGGTCQKRWEEERGVFRVRKGFPERKVF